MPFVCFPFRNGSYVPANDDQGVEGQNYADLELFLLGLHMEHILPVFKRHCVSLAVLFTMTDDDLKEVGSIKHSTIILY